MEFSLLKPKVLEDDTPPVAEQVIWQSSNFTVDVNKEFPITVKNEIDGKEYAISVCNATNIREVKEKIHLKSEYKPEIQRLYYMSKELEDGRTVADYYIAESCTIVLTLRSKGGCFSPNSLVTLSNGTYKEIQSITQNDIILAYNFETASTEPCKVNKLLRYQIDEFAHLTTSTGKQITTSFTHPFWVEGKGWAVARPEYNSGVPKLEIGDKFLSSSSEKVTLLEIDTRISESPQEVFTISLEEVHTFFVQDVLVHNSQIFVKPPEGKTLAIEAEPTDLVGTIKKRIAKQMNVPETHQKLLFGSIQLDDSKNLQFYDIQKEDTIILVVDLHRASNTNSIVLESLRVAQLTLYVLFERKKQKFKVLYESNISDLKDQIAEKFGILPQQQILLHNGKLIHDGLLSDCGFSSNDEIVLIPFNRGGSTLKFMHSVAKKQLSEIKELEDSLTFSLKEKTKAVMSEIRQLVQKKKATPQLSSLNEVGLASIILWTTDYIYRDVNTALREDKKDVEQWSKFINGLVWGLRELPPYQGKGYRGFKNSRDLSQYIVGKPILWKNITAISKKASTAKAFSNEKGIIFEIDVLSGRDISNISIYENEEEILLFPYSYFVVLDVKDVPNEPAYVKLKEVPVPQSPKIVLWVDDHPENNTKWVQELHKRGVSVLYSTNTKEALDLLNTYSWMLQLNDGDIRIVTDMVRDEYQGDSNKMVTNYLAGIDFIRQLRKTYAYGHKVMIFCRDEEAARKNCEKEKLNNIIVNASEKNLETFLHFLSVESIKIPHKESWTCNIQ